MVQVFESFSKEAFFDQTKDLMMRKKPTKFAEETQPQPKMEVKSEMPPRSAPPKEEVKQIPQKKEADPPAPKETKAEASSEPFMVIDMLKKQAEDEALKKLAPEDIPEAVTLEDLMNPDRLELIGCLSFLERYNADIEKYKQWLILEGHRALARKCDDGIMRGMKEALTIPARFKKGELSPDQYKANIQKILSTDEKLLVVYRKLNMVERAYLVEERIKYVNQELPNL